MWVNNYYLKSHRLKYGLHQLSDHFLGIETSGKLFGKRRKALETEIFKHFYKQKRKGECIPLDRIDANDIHLLKEKYIPQGIPVVVEGWAKGWPCCMNWSLDFFKKRYGNDEIVDANAYNPDRAYEVKTLASMIDNMKEDSSEYLRFYSLLHRHPEHYEDFDVKWLRTMRHKPSFSEAFWVFIGGRESYTTMHNANLGNIFIQAYGKKKWIFHKSYDTPVVDPEPTRNFYRSAPFKTEHPFNPYDPDYGNYPLFKFIDSYETVLEPGDVLWNPPYVWHTVKNLTDSIGVGYRWFAPFHCLKLEPLYFTLDLFSFHPPIWKSLKLIREDFNYIRLAEQGLLREYLEKQRNER